MSIVISDRLRKKKRKKMCVFNDWSGNWSGNWWNGNSNCDLTLKSSTRRAMYDTFSKIGIDLSGIKSTSFNTKPSCLVVRADGSWDPASLAIIFLRRDIYIQKCNRDPDSRTSNVRLPQISRSYRNVLRITLTSVICVIWSRFMNI